MRDNQRLGGRGGVRGTLNPNKKKPFAYGTINAWEAEEGVQGTHRSRDRCTAVKEYTRCSQKSLSPRKLRVPTTSLKRLLVCRFQVVSPSGRASLALSAARCQNRPKEIIDMIKCAPDKSLLLCDLLKRWLLK